MKKLVILWVLGFSLCLALLAQSGSLRTVKVTETPHRLIFEPDVLYITGKELTINITGAEPDDFLIDPPSQTLEIGSYGKSSEVKPVYVLNVATKKKKHGQITLVALPPAFDLRWLAWSATTFSFLLALQSFFYRRRSQEALQDQLKQLELIRAQINNLAPSSPTMAPSATHAVNSSPLLYDACAVDGRLQKFQKAMEEWCRAVPQQPEEVRKGKKTLEELPRQQKSADQYFLSFQATAETIVRVILEQSDDRYDRGLNNPKIQRAIQELVDAADFVLIKPAIGEMPNSTEHKENCTDPDPNPPQHIKGSISQVICRGLKKGQRIISKAEVNTWD